MNAPGYPRRDLSKYRLLVRSGRKGQFEPPKCCICREEIKVGQKYRDGGFGSQAHQLCLETEQSCRKRS